VQEKPFFRKSFTNVSISIKLILTHSSIIIDDVQRMCEGQSKYAVAFFYCNFRDSSFSDPDVLLRSVLHQLVRKLARDSPVVDQIVKEHAHLKSSSSLNVDDLMLTVSGAFSRTYVIVDALDECTALDRVLPSLVRLSACCRLLVMSRDEPVIRRAFGEFEKLELDYKAINRDIASFVHPEVQHRCKTGRLTAKDELLAKIENALTQGANGMYVDRMTCT
jgi:hypothetical protein